MQGSRDQTVVFKKRILYSLNDKIGAGIVVYLSDDYLVSVCVNTNIDISNAK